MTCFFDLQKLEEAAGDDNVKFVLLLKAFVENKLPSHKRGAVNKLPNMVGSSFLLNPKPLFTYSNKHIDIAYIVQYIKLAGRRDYALYKMYGSKTLPLSYYPDLNMGAIRTNRLLKITNTEIFFLYEEIKRIT